MARTKQTARISTGGRLAPELVLLHCKQCENAFPNSEIKEGYCKKCSESTPCLTCGERFPIEEVPGEGLKVPAPKETRIHTLMKASKDGAADSAAKRNRQTDYDTEGYNKLPAEFSVGYNEGWEHEIPLSAHKANIILARMYACKECREKEKKQQEKYEQHKQKLEKQYERQKQQGEKRSKLSSSTVLCSVGCGTQVTADMPLQMCKTCYHATDSPSSILIACMRCKEKVRAGTAACVEHGRFCTKCASSFVDEPCSLCPPGGPLFFTSVLGQARCAKHFGQPDAPKEPAPQPEKPSKPKKEVITLDDSDEEKGKKEKEKEKESDSDEDSDEPGEDDMNNCIGCGKEISWPQECCDECEEDDGQAFEERPSTPEPQVRAQPLSLCVFCPSL